MSGHTAQALVLMKVISKDQLQYFNWKLSHVRNILVIFMVILCLIYPNIRKGFGTSAIGHIGYILVRAGPVFRLGSVYVGDRPKWQGLSDLQRFKDVIMIKHPYMTAEVGSLLFLGLLFGYWRFMDS